MLCFRNQDFQKLQLETQNIYVPMKNMQEMLKKNDVTKIGKLLTNNYI